MIKLSRMADYAVVLMAYMARDGQPLRSAHEIARNTGIAEPTVSKVLKNLLNAGLLHSGRGLKGGYGLAQPADVITVIDIISAVDGPIALTACIEDSHSECGIEALCPTRAGWHKINEAIRKALEGITLEEVAKPVIPAAYTLHKEPLPLKEVQE